MSGFLARQLSGCGRPARDDGRRDACPTTGMTEGARSPVIVILARNLPLARSFAGEGRERVQPLPRATGKAQRSRGRAKADGSPERSRRVRSLRRAQLIENPDLFAIRIHRGENGSLRPMMRRRTSTCPASCGSDSLGKLTRRSRQPYRPNVPVV